MSHTLGDFSLEDMIIIGACLRSFDVQPRSLEEVARNVVRVLYQEFHDPETDAHACPSVCFFLAGPHRMLPRDLQEGLARSEGNRQGTEVIPCVILLAEEGELSWGNRLRGERWMRPLASAEFLLETPLVYQLFRQCCLAGGARGGPALRLREYDPNESCQVLHVCRAQQSPFVPEQDFVRDLGVESVLCMGGSLPGEQTFAVVVYARGDIPESTVHMFRSLVINIKLSLLQVSAAPVILDEAVGAVDPVPAAMVDSSVLGVAMQQLLASYEQTVVDQGFKLQVTMDKLRESELRFRRLIESSVVGIALSQGSVVSEANETFLRLLGYERQDLPLDKERLVSPESRDSYRLSLLEALERGSARPYEACYLRKDGVPVFALVGKVLIDREREAIVSLVLDLTAQKALEAEVRQSQKLEAVGRLAAGVAHELNTPIQYVSLNLRFLQDAFRDLGGVLEAYQDVLRQHELSPEAQARLACVEEQSDLEYLMGEVPQAIQQGLEGADRVATIVRAMKEFSHPGSPEKRLVDLNRSLQSTVEVSRNEWKYVADVVTDFDPELPSVPCLQGEMNQVFLNLIINAADAIHACVGREPETKGTITVRTRACGEHVEVSIRDTGTGIPEAIRQKIFEPFFTTKDVGKGTGQGLALAHAVVVDRHGGSIGLETTEGEGTTFTIRLPLVGPG